MFSLRMRKEGVDRRDDLGAFADRASDALDRTGPHVADGENAGHRGLESRPRRVRAVICPAAGRHETRLVDRNSAALQPIRRRVGADEEEDVADRRLGLRAGSPVAPPHFFDAAIRRAGESNDFRFRHEFDVRSRRDPVDHMLSASPEPRTIIRTFET